MRSPGWSRRAHAGISLLLTIGLVVVFPPSAFGERGSRAVTASAIPPEVWRGWVAHEWTDDYHYDGGTQYNVWRQWYADGDSASLAVDGYQSAYQYQASGCPPPDGGSSSSEGFAEATDTAESTVGSGSFGSEPGYSADEQGLIFSAVGDGWSANPLEGVRIGCSGPPDTTPFGANPNGFGERVLAVTDLADVPMTVAFSRALPDYPGLEYRTHSVEVCMTRSTADSDGDGLPDPVDLAPAVAGSLENLGLPGEPPYDEIHAKLDGGHSGKSGISNCPTASDSDADGVYDDDNCPDDYNPQQQDTDNDGKGDACDLVITWRVLPRMDDNNGDGILDKRYFEGRLSDPLEENQPLDVVLDACPAADVSWNIDDELLVPGPCNVTVPLPEGTHTISAASPTAGSSTVTIDPKHLMIVGLGDSYGSGEGVPKLVKRPDAPDAEWDQKACHRSRYSAQAQAALRLEQADEQSAVTFLHLACSGATTFKGVLGDYPDPPGGGSQRPQVVEAAEVTIGNPVDAVLLSLGGNDIGFAPVITECIIHTDCPTHRKDGKTLHKRTQKKLAADLVAGYDTASACLTTVNQAYCPAPTWLHVPTSRVYVTEYPSLGRDSSGDYCKKVMGGFSGSELRWATEVVQQGKPGTTWNYKGSDLSVESAGINTAIRSFGSDSGSFTPVTGIFDASRRHGYCATEPWVVRLGESFDNQGDKNGAMHPNRAGQKAYGRIIFEKVSADLI